MEYPKDLGTDEALAQRISTYFSEERLNVLGRSSGFVRRSTARLHGHHFLLLNVFNPENGKNSSLNDQCDYLETHFGIKMTKQSLDERYNTHAVEFMQKCYDTLLSSVLQPTSEEKPSVHVPLFKRIELIDATSYKIPDSFASFYKGGGGVRASVKLHHRYDLLKGESIATKIVAGNENDAVFLEDLDPVLEADCLYIKDLGYWKVSHFAKIAAAKGYFLSRMRALTNCFVKKDGGFVGLSLQEMVKKSTHTSIYIGKEKLEVTIKILPVSEATAAKRMKKVTKSARTHHTQVQADTLLLCHYNVYVTNISESILDKLPLEWIQYLYQLRWQIELIFKIWKSLFEIDEIRKMSVYRFECFLYGRLIAILLAQKVQNLFKAHIWQAENAEISEYKCFDILKKK